MSPEQLHCIVANGHLELAQMGKQIRLMLFGPDARHAHISDLNSMPLGFKILPGDPLYSGGAYRGHRWLPMSEEGVAIFSQPQSFT